MVKECESRIWFECKYGKTTSYPSVRVEGGNFDPNVHGGGTCKKSAAPLAQLEAINSQLDAATEYIRSTHPPPTEDKKGWKCKMQDPRFCPVGNPKKCKT